MRFGPSVAPEDEKTPRYFCPAGTPGTAIFVAMMAQSARAFQPYMPEYSARCIEAAHKSYAYLLANPEDRSPDQSKFRTGGYITKDPDDRLWAAAELWETTGDGAALKDVESRIRSLQPTFQEHFDWQEVKNLGLLTYLFSGRPGRDPALMSALKEHLVATANVIVEKARAHPYSRPLDTYYTWGGNGVVARQAVILMAANRVTPNPAYRETVLDAVNHLFGRNVHGRSYVTGLGDAPPLFPHDRRSGPGLVDRPWPGYLVGGPHPTAHDWFDVEPDFKTNEIAINWNAALIYALAAFQ